ncbi:MAG: chromosomal replication initiator protein DnaA [Planctomycetota bacterium]
MASEIDLQDLWNSVRHHVYQHPRFEPLSPWLSCLRPVDLSAEHLFLCLDDSRLRPFLRQQHFDLLNEAVGSAKEEACTVVLLESDNRRHGGAAVDPKPPGASVPSPDASGLNNRYVFDTFVVGPCNRLAAAASRAVCEAPGTHYNPLFLHAGVGMGKTHLLQAICQEIHARHPAWKVEYLSCEEYLHALALAVREDALAAFRARFLSIEVLLLDNVQFLTGDAVGQREFFHLFNALHNKHRQIVLSSTHNPKHMKEIQEPLASRFMWGLVVELEIPTVAVRHLLIRQKAREFRIVIPEEVVAFLADSLTGNIREIEGAMVKLSGHVSLLKQPISLDVTKHALHEYLPQGRSQGVTIRIIQEKTCDVFHLSLADLLSKRRARSLVLPRHVAMYLSRILTASSLEEVGQQFGQRDHSTVKHAFEKINLLLHKDLTVRSSMETIKSRVLNSC